LIRSGAVIVGGVNMHEIGIGNSGFNKHLGHARNPHDFKHHTGGSSSGSVSLVAAGVVPLAIGFVAY
jgi:Asp-tRNA(Asn)/Glu-tRNA(Gln) amidotransferase A subunit family amidase